MHADVVDLSDFYTGRLGQVARRMIRRRIRLIWPNLTGMRLLGLGYATPYLKLFREEAERVLALMPPPQGVLPWPLDAANVVALADEGELPLQDFSIDRVLLVHSLEHSEQVRALLKEVWRVLAGGGRLMVVVPNRRGIWARIDATRFGERWFTTFAGVSIVEATKQIYAAKPAAKRKEHRRRVYVPVPSGAPRLSGWSRSTSG